MVRVLRTAQSLDWIVLNDFHALTYGAQRQLAKDLKYVAEHSAFRFILVGSWSGGSRFLDLNEDSSAVISQVYVRPWTTDELRSVLAVGGGEVGIQFDEDTASLCIGWACGSLRNLHEIALRVCQLTRPPGSAKRPRPMAAECQTGKSALASIFNRPFAKYRQLIRSFCECTTMTVAKPTLQSAARDYLARSAYPEAKPRGQLAATMRAALSELGVRNADARVKAEIRRGLIESLTIHVTQGIEGPFTLEAYMAFVAARNESLGGWLPRPFERALKHFVSAARHADMAPDPLEYDRVDSSIRIVVPEVPGFSVADARE